MNKKQIEFAEVLWLQLINKYDYLEFDELLSMVESNDDLKPMRL